MHVIKTDSGSGASHAPEQVLDRTAWGLFLIWFGYAMWANVGWGIALVGAGAIVLGAQGMRMLSGMALDGFWSIMGVLMLVAGGLRLFNIEVALVPLALVLVGLVVVVSAWLHRSKP